MMTPRKRLHKCALPFAAAALAGALSAVLSACGSVPGETLASGGVRRDVSRRVLADATAAAPACRNQRVADTEVVEVHPDGKVAAERWTVEQCGTRVHYRVVFPAAGKATPLQVRRE
jgi:hypothetical protein